MLEIIATSLLDAREAALGGAQRLEVCAALEQGGQTPSLELVASIVDAVAIPVRVMIRTNAGFSATHFEIATMRNAVHALIALPIEGLVAGFLTAGGALDLATLDAVLEPAPTRWRLTFHRALESAAGSLDTNIAAIAAYGRADRILVGAGPLLSAATACARKFSTLEVIAGGGLTLENLRHWARESGCREFHCGRAAREDGRLDRPVSAARVRDLRAAVDVAVARDAII